MMENPKAPNYRRLAILGGLFFILSIVLLFWARDVVREMIVLPLSYIFFVIGVLIDYTPQIFFWIVVLLLGARIAYLSVSRKRKRSEEEIRFFRPVEERPVTSGRVMYWANKVHLLRSGRGVYYTRTFHEALSKTLFQLLAYRYRISPVQVEEGLKDGSLDIPPEIREYALERMRDDVNVKERSWDTFWDGISAAFQNVLVLLKTAFQKVAGGTNSMPVQVQSVDAQGHSDQAARRNDSRLADIDTQVRRVLNYMEEELEVPHDDTGR
jgi:Ca2+/Na+ antiporter